MRPVLRGIDTLKPNRLEAEILSGRSIRYEADYFRAAEGILAQGVRRVIISAGSRGCYYADNMGQRLWSRTRPLQQVENATGAGDSFMAGLLYSAAQRCWLGDTMDFAMGAALAALRSPHHHQSSDQSGAHLAAGAGARAPPYPGDPHRQHREIMPQDSSFVMNPAAN